MHINIYIYIVSRQQRGYGMQHSTLINIDDMIDQIVKKDDDAGVHSVNLSTGEVEIDTSLDLENSDICHVVPENGPILDHSMLRDDASAPNGSVPIRIAFTVFSVLAVNHFISIITGIFVYFILLYDTSAQAAIVVFSVTSTLVAVFYAGAAWQRKEDIGTVFAACMGISRIFALGSLSRLWENETLFLLEVVYLYQTAFLSVYTTHKPRADSEDDVREVSGWDARCLGYIRASRYTSLSFYWLLFSSIIVWVIGLLFFIHYLNRDLMWLAASLSFLLVVATSIYKSRFMAALLHDDSSSYSLSIGDRKRAAIEYYAEPLLLAWKKATNI